MRLVVLSYNIHKCIGGIDRRCLPERVAETIEHYRPDVVLMQEVANDAKRAGNIRQVDWLGERLGYRHRTWFPNVQLLRGGEYGNGILSRFPITSTENIDVTLPRRKRRSVLHARLRVRFGAKRRPRTMHVYNLHLGLSGKERKKQLELFLDHHPFRGLDARAPVVVAGDFNDVWGTLGKQLAPAGFRGIGRRISTFPAYAPIRALDCIYTRGGLELLEVQRSRLKVATQASDHLPLIADVRIRA